MTASVRPPAPTEDNPITGAQALRLLREVVAESPDFIYKPPADDVQSVCVYAYDGQPSCIVGKALYRAGYDVDVLAALDCANDPGAYNLAKLGIAADGDALAIFAAAQRVQDRSYEGNTWTDALAAAEVEADWLGVVA
jgi:hypothetical protein